MIIFFISLVVALAGLGAGWLYTYTYHVGWQKGWERAHWWIETGPGHCRYQQGLSPGEKKILEKAQERAQEFSTSGSLK